MIDLVIKRSKWRTAYMQDESGNCCVLGSYCKSLGYEVNNGQYKNNHLYTLLNEKHGENWVKDTWKINDDGEDLTEYKEGALKRHFGQVGVVLQFVD